MLNAKIRATNLKIGTTIGLVGDYNSYASWGETHILSMTVAEYITVERHHSMSSVKNELDIAMICIRETPIAITGYEGLFVGTKFLILQRYPDLAWDNGDPNVHAFGIPDDLQLTTDVKLNEWRSKAEWLSSSSIMCVLDDEQTSPLATVFREKNYSII